MSDIVERLRAHGVPIWTAQEQCDMCLEAANEIEMLRIELDDAVLLIRAISNGKVEFRPMPRQVGQESGNEWDEDGK